MVETGSSFVLLPRRPPELLVADELTDCPYFPDRSASMPLRMPVRPLTPREWDQRLAEGDRRHGVLLYRTACPACNACEPIRVDVRAFRFSRNMLRVLARGNRVLSVEMGPPIVSASRIALYEKHKKVRDLALDVEREITRQAYQNFAVDRCVDSFELRYLFDDQLVGIAVTDQGQTSLSAVYCYYDPDFSSLGVGTFSILTQIRYCMDRGLRYLYLGLYIADNRHMSYKARFMPHERLIGGQWRRFERGG